MATASFSHFSRPVILSPTRGPYSSFAARPSLRWCCSRPSSEGEDSAALQDSGEEGSRANCRTRCSDDAVPLSTDTESPNKSYRDAFGFLRYEDPLPTHMTLPHRAYGECHFVFHYTVDPFLMFHQELLVFKRAVFIRRFI